MDSIHHTRDYIFSNIAVFIFCTTCFKISILFTYILLHVPIFYMLLHMLQNIYSLHILVLYVILHIPIFYMFLHMSMLYILFHMPVLLLYSIVTTFPSSHECTLPHALSMRGVFSTPPKLL